MPKTVFTLLWSTIQKNMPIAAYVKNRAIDGTYYWVLATVFPVPNGYVSIRLKPSTAFFDPIAGLYAEMSRIEKNRGITESVEFLNKTLLSLGISDYREFMTKALVAELDKLNQTLHASQNKTARASDSLGHLGDGLKKIASVSEQFAALNSALGPALETIETSFTSLKSLSINMALVGTHLGKKAATVNVIAEAFLKFSEESGDQVARIRTNHLNLRSMLTETEFKIASTHLQSVMLIQFMSDGVKSKENVQILMDLTRSLLQETTAALASMNQTLGRFLDVCEQTDQSILALELVRLSGKVESAQIPNGNAEVGPYLTDLEDNLAGLVRLQAISQTSHAD